jgi:hypothetical protein
MARCATQKCKGSRGFGWIGRKIYCGECRINIWRKAS